MGRCADAAWRSADLLSAGRPPLAAWPDLRAAVFAGDPAAIGALISLAPDLADAVATAGRMPAEPTNDPVVSVRGSRSGPGGVVVYDNLGWSPRHVPTELPTELVHVEVYPQPGTIWTNRITVDGRQLHILRTVARTELAYPAVAGLVGTATPAGEIATACGPPGSFARSQVLTGADAEPLDGVVVFTDDDIFTTVSGWRDADTDLYVNTAAVDPDANWIVDWAPESVAYGLPRFRLALDVPAEVDVRCWLAGTELPVVRGYASPRDEPEPLGPVDPELHLPIIDLSAGRADYPDPDQPWPIRLVLRGLPPGPFRGAHIVAEPPRRTERFTFLPDGQLPWLSGAIDSSTSARMYEGWTLPAMVVANRFRGDPPGARYDGDVVYGHTPEGPLRALVCRRADPSERAPAIVFVHGGGWRSGDPGFHYRHMWWLARHGYVTMSITYRKHPDVTWRESLADLKCAVRWVRAHATELGADPDRIAICGGSAGGHLAGLLATTAGEFDGSGDWADQSSAVSAAMLFYPPVDMVKLRAFAGPHVVEVVDQYFGSDLVLASPASHLGPATPPILTITGGADRVVPLGPIEQFHAELDRLGVANKLVVYPGRDHAFELFTSDWDDSAAELLHFAREHLGRPSALDTSVGDTPVGQIAP